MPEINFKQKKKYQYSIAPAIRAYLGGSFDPVHNGHLQMALYVYQYLLPIAKQQQRALHVSLLPNARSPFKQNSTDPEHRLAMLKLATKDTPLQINELELWQTPPVYTIDSVQTLRARYPHDSLIFIMGMDSARSLEQWKDGLRLTDYVNLWVFDRSSLSDSDNTLFDNALFNNTIFKTDNSFYDTDKNFNDKKIIPQDMAVLPAHLQSQLSAQLQHLTVSLATELLTPVAQYLTASHTLKSTNQGHIYIDSRPVAAVSSTQIRQQLQQTKIRLNIMPLAETQITSVPPINDIISNTKPNPLAKWLNPAVYQYIIAHQLYSAAQFR
ncbi:nicotinate-nicotinamide nucleotide adenylyltransferase [Psychrobacter sp. DAB_AL62B]|uniref:nicotinate-nicotinamide nucleotide adenylyltransferase n=1 Tax=Psychrobacter sp. DAB_AL62B TaxID=1028420 RepID=UPI002380F126|nr:nicotinate-nicotinamide nucleotide adenylyltransferase [Psychrobacter sp. DAB_AL62B]MDE4454437.1 nicotinate-nicotinamide nucleotide adenylyltransferase [Psychrobacter sp. DAB_AL62B]